MSFFNKIFAGFSLGPLRIVSSRFSSSSKPFSQELLKQPEPLPEPPQHVPYKPEKRKEIEMSFKEMLRAAKKSKQSKALPAGKRSKPADLKIFPFKEPENDIKNNVVIKTSKIPNAGDGVFVTKDLPKGLFVGTYQGRVLTQKEVEASKSKYIMKINIVGRPTIYVDGAEHGNWTKKLNHNKNSNLKLLANGNFITQRAISKGEELTFDYGPHANWFISGDEDKVTKFIEGNTDKSGAITYFFEHQPGIDIPQNQVTIGAGAFGTVIKGKFQGKDVAIKVQALSEEVGKKRFEKEVKNAEAVATFYKKNALLTSALAKVTRFQLKNIKEDYYRRQAQGAYWVGLEVYPLHTGYMTLNNFRDKRRLDFINLWSSFRNEILKDCKLFWKHGLYHDDLHLGNIMINPQTWDLILIDYGMLKKLDPAKDKWPRIEKQYDFPKNVKEIIGGRAPELPETVS